MSVVNTVENIRAWFLTCPTVSEILMFGVDYLGSKATECAIYALPSTLKYTEDVIGTITYNKRQVRSFVLAVRFPFSDDAQRNLENLKFFDVVQQWMYEQNELKNFPEIEEGAVVSIIPTKTQCVVSANADSADYQLQFSITYDRED